ncbi:amidohydrolase family protein [Pseudonocardia kunmingensis]|uniref:amidohydrolase family protein n=1 Tax=Pseudonocardia kunmingensis TaxID=630975 RepID=UPI001153683B|nr:amidohydrolase family protein [Pseudonocardia kunmingensis]
MTRADLVHALTHVTVVDATGAPARPDQTLLVDGATITTIGPSAEVPVPRSAAVLDLTGKYLIPGLVDMHVHSGGADVDDERLAPALYVANGNTTVREMWGRPQLHEWRRRRDAGELLGPRSIIGSPLVDGAPALWSDIPGAELGIDHPVLVATTPAQARRAVAEAVDGGADFVKVYSRLEREPYLAVLDEAYRRDIPVAGHRSDNFPLAEQIERGQRSFEHLFGLGPATSSDPERWEAALARIALGPDFYFGSWFTQVGQVEWDAVGDYSRPAATALFDRIVAADVAFCPTLVMHAAIDLPDFVRTDDPLLRYLPPDTPEAWSFLQREVFHDGGRSPEVEARRRVLFDHRRAAVAAMDEAGVRLLAGTDNGTPGTLPGFALHEELELLVGAGLSPMRALQTATLEPARFLGCEDRSGTIQPGRIADLVVLDADPLDDIRNTTRIHAVMVEGRYVGPAERRELLTTAAAVAAEGGVPPVGPDGRDRGEVGSTRGW